MKKSMSDIIAQLLIMAALIIIPICQIIICVRASYTNDMIKEIIRIERVKQQSDTWRKYKSILQQRDTLYFKTIKE